MTFKNTCQDIKNSLSAVNKEGNTYIVKLRYSTLSWKHEKHWKLKCFIFFQETLQEQFECPCLFLIEYLAIRSKRLLYAVMLLYKFGAAASVLAFALSMSWNIFECSFTVKRFCWDHVLQDTSIFSTATTFPVFVGESSLSSSSCPLSVSRTAAISCTTISVLFKLSFHHYHSSCTCHTFIFLDQSSFTCFNKRSSGLFTGGQEGNI